MSKLTELLQKVRDEKLGLRDLEKFRDQLIYLKTDISIEISQKKKARALWMLSNAPESSVAQRKLLFEGTDTGQRLIELEGYYRGLQGEIDSLQSRVYAMLRIYG